MAIREHTNLGVFSAALAAACATLAWSRWRRRRLDDRVQRNAGLADERHRTSERLGAVAHELRTPLNSIAGWIQVLQSGQADAATTAKALDSMSASVRAQVRLIEDLVDATRSDGGRLDVRMARLDLRDPLTAAIDSVRPAAEAARLSLRTAIPPQPCLICGDAERLRQVVGNILSNSVKFTSTGTIHVALTVAAGHAEVRVVDSGRGIPPDFLPRVFERFEQADRSTRRKSGLGLGLAICRDLIERHHGSISVMSKGLDQGTTVTITLPLAVASTGRLEGA